MKSVAIAIAVLGLTAVIVPAAHAATISYDGAGGMVLTGAPGENNHVLIYPAGDGSANVDVSDYQPLTAPGDKCEPLTPELMRCAIPTALRVSLGDGKDSFSPDRTLKFAKQIDGGEGDDELMGTDGTDVLIGGPGNDTVKGYDGDDQLDGGDGDDTVIGGIGKDTRARRGRGPTTSPATASRTRPRTSSTAARAWTRSTATGPRAATTRSSRR